MENPQAWNRYSYVRNNPIRYNDPSGHRVDDGCLGDNGGCNLTSLQKGRDAQKLADITKESDDRKCAKGNRAYCSGYVNMANNFIKDASLMLNNTWDALTDNASGIGISDIIQPIIEIYCNYKGTDCEPQAYSIAQTVDLVVEAATNVLHLVENSNGPSVNTNPVTPIPLSPWPTWTPDPTPTGITSTPIWPSTTSTPYPR